LRTERIFVNMVSMTRNTKRKISKTAKGRSRTHRPPKKGRWPLQDAKARFSELVRRVQSEGPQHVTVHGRDEVVLVAADEFRRMKGNLTGQLLIDAMQASPHRDIDIEPRREPMLVRDVNL
jgi:prevent-host-death family protein